MEVQGWDYNFGLLKVVFMVGKIGRAGGKFDWGGNGDMTWVGLIYSL